MTVRVRFAPSPTGLLHVGNARTALVNWLYARHHGGRFILRIEDTDPVRSDAGLAAAILTDLEWLGLRWDEGPFHQSQARDEHRLAAHRLLGSGHAYRCFCSTAELEADRRRQETERRPPRYSGRCREITAAEASARERAGGRATVRLRMPDRAIVVDDLVHGRVLFEGADFDDFILLRADGSPSYHLAVVVDDHGMGISHVIRGDDHLANTPRHIALAEALGQVPPRFAHLPLIGGGGGGPLSKREGGLTVASLRAGGFLPEAVVNYLALLGWPPPAGQPEVLSLHELAAHFTLERVSRASARVDERRLHWFNEQHLRRADPRRLADLLGLAPDDAGGRRAVEALRGEVASLAEIRGVLTSLSRDPETRGGGLAVENQPALEELAVRLDAPLEGMDHARRLLDGVIRAAPGRSKRSIMRAVREALTGSPEGPPVATLLWIVGAAVARRRLSRALTASPTP